MPTYKSEPLSEDHTKSLTHFIFRECNLDYAITQKSPDSFIVEVTNIDQSTIELLTIQEAKIVTSRAPKDSLLKRTIMRRDEISSSEADNQISSAIDELNDRLSGESDADPYSVCEDYFGLEPDYLFDLIG